MSKTLPAELLLSRSPASLTLPLQPRASLQAIGSSEQTVKVLLLHPVVGVVCQKQYKNSRKLQLASNIWSSSRGAYRSGVDCLFLRL